MKRFAERADRLRVGDRRTPRSALISPAALEKVSGYISPRREEGAQRAGGRKNPLITAHTKAVTSLRPTVLADVSNRMRVAQEEIFGPSRLSAAIQKDEAEGLRGNDVEYGLASYIWTGT